MIMITMHASMRNLLSNSKYPKSRARRRRLLLSRSDIIAITAYITIAGDETWLRLLFYSGFSIQADERGGFFPVGFLIFSFCLMAKRNVAFA
jgi:hypothetical protein